MYHSLSSNYNELFFGHIASFAENVQGTGLLNERSYCLFYPSLSIKKDEPIEFLIYGQAVNGWIDVNVENYSREEFVKLIDWSNEYFSLNGKLHSPLDFVNALWSKSIYKDLLPEEQSFYSIKEPQYWFCRSFFWRVIYKLVSDHYTYGRETWDWSQKLVWSNLYKIAPEEGANPDWTERNCQQKDALELVKREIDELNPTNCIFITNWVWVEPFIEYLKPTQIFLGSDSSVIYQGKYNNTNIIVTTRPFLGSGEGHVADLLKLVK